MDERIREYLLSRNYAEDKVQLINDKWKVLKGVIEVRLSDEETTRLFQNQTAEQVVYALEHQEVNELMEGLERVKEA